MPSRPKRRQTLEGITVSHPVVPVILSKKDPVTNSLLPEFLDHCLSLYGQIPYTLTEFYEQYLTYVVQKQTHKYRDLVGLQKNQWTTESIARQFSRLAFLHYTKGTRITRDMILKQMDGNSYKSELSHDIEYVTLGIFVEDGMYGRKPVYKFRETVFYEYLVAQFHLQECVRKVEAGKKTNLVSGNLMDSMDKLPDSGDIWRLTFGLISNYPRLKKCQANLLAEIIDFSKRKDGMTSFDLSSLCIEIIYESQNAGALAELLDDFSMNQTINYSNIYINRARVAYAVLAAGYLVRAASEVYALHLANFGLNVEHLALLADPVNAISDNSLQVLNISGNDIGDEGMKKLQRFLVKASLLTHLDMSDCNLGSHGSSILSEFFMCLPLRYLKLSGNYIGDKGLLRMASNLVYLPTLEWVDLSRNDLTDKSVVSFSQKLKHLPNLRSLDLCDNSIGEKGVAALSKALPLLTQVVCIKIAENRPGNQRATEFVKHAWKTKSLKHININLSEIPSEGVLGLKRISYSQDLQLHHADTETDEEGAENTEDKSLEALNASAMISPLDDAQEVSFHVMPSWDSQKSASMDLLAGRPDCHHAVNLRRSTSRSNSLPRLKDVRRSWHNLSGSFRESFRGSLKEPRRVPVAESTPNGLPRQRAGFGKSLRDSMRSTGASIRNSFRRSSQNDTYRSTASGIETTV